MGPVYGKRPYSNAERPSEGNYTSEPPPTDTLDRSEQCAPLAEGKEKLPIRGQPRADLGTRCLGILATGRGPHTDAESSDSDQAPATHFYGIYVPREARSPESRK